MDRRRAITIGEECRKSNSGNNGSNSDVILDRYKVFFYTTNDDSIIVPKEMGVVTPFNTSIVSNTYEDGQGVIICDDVITTINYYAFSNCTNLVSITIPDGVNSISHRVFDGCVNLCEFKGKFSSSDGKCLIVDGVLKSFARYGVIKYTIPDDVVSIEDSAFSGCIDLKQVIFNDKINVIGSYAFRKCGLTSIIFPTSITSLGGQSFCDCEMLKEVYFTTETPPSVGGYSFSDYYLYSEAYETYSYQPLQCYIYVPNNSIDAYKTAINHNRNYIKGYDILPSQEPIHFNDSIAGDIAYYTNGEIKTTSILKWDKSLGTPIGVVVIPKDFIPDGRMRIVSLKNAGSGVWSNVNNDSILSNYNKVPITNNTGSLSSSSNLSGNLPSDRFDGDASFVDSNANYNTTTTNKIPSPYNGDKFNTDYSKTISSYGNALSDFNGSGNTQTLVGLGSDYVAANKANSYTDGVSNIQWYLPSAGELGFLLVRYKSIGSTISMLKATNIPDTGLWTSTECSSSHVYYMSVSGIVDDLSKSYSRYVRPFAMLDINEENKIIKFAIDHNYLIQTYNAEDGMTWGEFVNSIYADVNIHVNSNEDVLYNYSNILYNGASVKSSDVIIKNYIYGIN